MYTDNVCLILHWLQYTLWNMKGRRVPILVAEQGIGRGAEPLTSFLNFFADRAGGDWSTTYAPKPAYFTNQHRALFLENSEMTFFDLRDDDSVVIETWSTSIRGRVLYGTSLLQLVTEMTSYTGRMAPLPDWTQHGAILGLQGGTQTVRHLLQRMEMLEHPNLSFPASSGDSYNGSDPHVDDLKVPFVAPAIAGVWLQDWVGLRHAFDGDRLQWNWQLDSMHYPNWQLEIADYLRSRDIRILTYINPFFSPTHDLPIRPETQAASESAVPTSNQSNGEIDSETGDNGANLPRQRRNLYQEGIDAGYFVRRPNDLAPYVLHSGSIEFCMLDLTNPEARRWMKEIIKQEMVSFAGASGWMADFAEYLPFDAVLHNTSISAAAFHNLYPQEWAKLNYEASQELLTSNRGASSKGGMQSKSNTSPTKKSSTVSGSLPAKTSSDLLFFVRSGWTQSPQYARAFWLGDQMVSWDRHDGFQSMLTGALSGGLCGHSLTHSDIGGYTIQERGPMAYIRTEELLLRWIEATAFGPAVFRTHMGLSISQKNAQVFSSPRIIAHFNLFSQIFALLAPYRQVLMQEAQRLGWPLMRPMSAHYGEDANTWSLQYQFMFGDVFLVAPVLGPGEQSAKANTHEGARCDGSNDRQQARDGGCQFPQSANSPVFADLPVGLVNVYLPAGSTWIHLWSGEEIRATERDSTSGTNRTTFNANQPTTVPQAPSASAQTTGRGSSTRNSDTSSVGRFVTLEVPIGAPPVFFRPDSDHGWALRRKLLALGLGISTVTTQEIDEKQVGEEDHQEFEGSGCILKCVERGVRGVWGGRMTTIATHRERDWYDWLGIKQFMSSSTSSSSESTPFATSSIVDTSSTVSSPESDGGDT